MLKLKRTPFPVRRDGSGNDVGRGIHVVIEYVDKRCYHRVQQVHEAVDAYEEKWYAVYDVPTRRVLFPPFRWQYCPPSVNDLKRLVAPLNEGDDVCEGQHSDLLSSTVFAFVNALPSKSFRAASEHLIDLDTDSTCSEFIDAFCNVLLYADDAVVPLRSTYTRVMHTFSGVFDSVHYQSAQSILTRFNSTRLKSSLSRSASSSCSFTTPSSIIPSPSSPSSTMNRTMMNDQVVWNLPCGLPLDEARARDKIAFFKNRVCRMIFMQGSFDTVVFIAKHGARVCAYSLTERKRIEVVGGPDVDVARTPPKSSEERAERVSLSVKCLRTHKRFPALSPDVVRFWCRGESDSHEHLQHFGAYKSSCLYRSGDKMSRVKTFAPDRRFEDVVAVDKWVDVREIRDERRHEALPQERAEKNQLATALWRLYCAGCNGAAPKTHNAGGCQGVVFFRAEEALKVEVERRVWKVTCGDDTTGRHDATPKFHSVSVALDQNRQFRKQSVTGTSVVVSCRGRNACLEEQESLLVHVLEALLKKKE